MLPFGHSKLVRINFRGDWNVEVDELICLLQVLPNLKEIEFKSFHFDNNLGDRELIEVTKTHPALVFVTADIVRTTEPPSALGLVIEFVDDRHDLFNLLTVSKDVFQIAARRLYRDPIKTSSIVCDGSIPKLILFLLLDEVEELEVELEDKERYLSNAAKMTQMRKIWIRTVNFNYKEMPDLAVAMNPNVE
ncbi:hypothetical protein BGW42_007596 [Actinomortierella wolfii]|nr:hypothetical protein BGW42_007596 [Actinomortierella wolfii]